MNNQAYPTLTCVIVTYNGAKWLSQCLSSISQSTIAVNIVVVDNGSNDDSVVIAKAHQGVEVIQLVTNLGFGRANNIGIARALNSGAERVFLLNQDTQLSPNALELLLKESLLEPDIGILCPMQLDAAGRALDATFLRYYLALHAIELIDDALLERGLKSNYPVAAAPAAAWVMTRQFLENVGGFDPLFFMYCEDDDLCARAAYHGFKVVVVPAARFYHCRGFHHEVDRETRRRRIRRKTSRIRSVLVRDLKDPATAMWKNTWRALTNRTLQSIGALLNHLDWMEAVASLAAVTRVIFELPSIARNRRQCLQKGPHWLSQVPYISVSRVASIQSKSDHG